MKLTRVGVDLAKQVFQVHGVDRAERPVWCKRLKRARWIADLERDVEPGCEIGMEACGGAHHWARGLQAKGYGVKLIAPQFDIAVRMTPPKQGALVAKRVATVTLGLHAHQSYLAQCGTPRTTAELERHSLVGFDIETPFIRAARKALPMWTREVFALRTDSDLAQLALIRSGCGIGVCQVPIAKRDPSLVRVMARQFEFKLEMWVTMHEDLRNSPRCKVTFDALVRGLAAVRQA